MCAQGRAYRPGRENGHPKIALGTLVAAVESTRDLGETGSVWLDLLFNEVATQIWVVHHLTCTYQTIFDVLERREAANRSLADVQAG